jgi:hypothetical protein
MEKTNTIRLMDHGVSLTDYFGGTSGVMITISIDNQTTIKQCIESLEQEFNMIGDHITYTAKYHNFIGNLDKQLDKIIDKLKKENKDYMDEVNAPNLDFNFETESQEDIDCQEYPVWILSLEFTWEEPDTYSIAQLEKRRVSKGELFANYDKSKSFDFALPQEWLNSFANYCEKRGLGFLSYHLILSTTVWTYPENKPVSLCTEVQDEIDNYLHYNNPGMPF